jgi:Uncharacterized protein conserved in archaea
MSHFACAPQIVTPAWRWHVLDLVAESRYRRRSVVSMRSANFEGVPMTAKTCLILDIGSGTQDVLLSGRPGTGELPQVHPALTGQGVAARIRELNGGSDIYLYGQNMGGGFWRAVKAHQDAGLKVFAHPDAALALGMIWTRCAGTASGSPPSRPFRPRRCC